MDDGVGASKKHSQIADSMIRNSDPFDVHNSGMIALGLGSVWMKMYESNQLPNNYNNKNL